MSSKIAKLIGRSDYIDGLVGKGPYQVRDPMNHFNDMLSTPMCGVNAIVLVEWNGKIIMFDGEHHDNKGPCPINRKASNFFQAMMHVFTECPEVDMIYEGHKFMVDTKDPSILETMENLNYPFHLLHDCEAITQTTHYLDVLRCIHVALLHSPQTPRVKSVLKRMKAFDCREPILKDPWKYPDDETWKRSLRKAVATNIADTDFAARARAAKSLGDYTKLFIEFPDHLAVKLITKSSKRFIIVYCGADHVSGILKRLKGARVIKRSQASAGLVSCSMPVR